MPTATNTAGCSSLGLATGAAAAHLGERKQTIQCSGFAIRRRGLAQDLSRSLRCFNRFLDDGARLCLLVFL